ncbi:hypothetical protein [Globicatella sanguinis]
MSGLELRLKDLFEATQLCGGVGRRSENHLIFYFLPTPILIHTIRKLIVSE